MPPNDDALNVARTGGHKLAKGVLWNLLGQGFPLLVALVTIPRLVEAYGTARFGVLALIWVTIIISLFDFGLGRALTQAIASRSDDPNKEDAAPIIWTTLSLMGLLGLAAGALMFLLSPWLIQLVLNVPSQLSAEATISFQILGIFAPILIINQGFRGIIEAHLKFQIINFIGIPTNSMVLLGPFLLLTLSHSLVPAVICIVLVRLLAGMAYLWSALNAAPGMRCSIRLSTRGIAPLLRFGGWIAISNLVSPIMDYFDRFLIGSVLSVTAVAYYSAPYDVATRLAFVPRAIGSVLFPAFAASFSEQKESAFSLYKKGLKLTFFVLFVPFFLLFVFSNSILDLWVGKEFSAHSARTLQILSLGVFCNGLALIPYVFVQGIGRADITAKFHLVEFPFFIALLWWGISNFGIEGAAAVWTLRVTADMVLLLAAVSRLTRRSAIVPLSVGVAVAGAGAMAVLIASIESLQAKLALSGSLCVLFLAGFWLLALTVSERRFALSLGAVWK